MDKQRKNHYEKMQNELNKMNENNKNYKKIIKDLEESQVDMIKTDNPLRQQVNKILKDFGIKKTIANRQNKNLILSFLKENIDDINKVISKKKEEIERIPPSTSGNIRSIPFISSDATSSNSLFV